MIFGALQEIFEWLPISSTGELILTMVEFFGYAVEDATSLAFFLHVGTPCSAILYFRKDIKKKLSVLYLTTSQTIQKTTV